LNIPIVLNVDPEFLAMLTGEEGAVSAVPADAKTLTLWLKPGDGGNLDLHLRFD